MENKKTQFNLPKLNKGSTIGFFSPSCPITFDAPYAVQKAENFLQKRGYKIKRGNLFGKIDSYYRSGKIEKRANELNELIYDNTVDCIMATAGGYVSVSILPYIDYEYLKKHPKIIVGHSDVTSVLLAVYEKCGFPVFYGPNFVTSFAHSEEYCTLALNAFEKAVNYNDPYVIKNFDFYTDEATDWYLKKDAFDKQISNEKRIKNKMKTIVAGQARGRLIGGNTDNLSLLYGNPYCPQIKSGDILFLENVNEEADFFERILANLFTFGIFDKISGLILGKAKGYDDITSGKSETDILSEMIKNPRFPILADFDCGHTVPINTLPIGKEIILDTEKQQITLL